MNLHVDENKKLDKLLETIKSDDSSKTTKSRLATSLKTVSPETILNSDSLNDDQKVFILKIKHENKLHKVIKQQDGKIYYGTYKIVNYRKQKVFIDFINHKESDTYEIEGYITKNPFPDNVKISLSINGRIHSVERTERNQREKKLGNFMIDDGGAFKVSFKLNPNAKSIISFVVDVFGVQYRMRIKTGEFTRLAPLTGSYRCDAKRLFTKRPKSISVSPRSKIRHYAYEIRFMLRLLFNWQIRHALGRLVILKNEGKLNTSSPVAIAKESIRSIGVSAEAVVMLPRAYILRIRYHIAKRRKKRPIWLISDRATAAGDNGEALFKYISQLDDCPADVYFVIYCGVKDFDRLRQFGKVLDQASLKYKLKFLLADKIISSQANTETYNPFVRQINHFVDLYNYDFIFLQHGVIRDDLSNWLNRYNRNISLFITSAQKEYYSILELPYYYGKENVLLSGQPRYDLLENMPNKKLILTPTYRGNLLRFGADKKGQRRYDPKFKHSRYRNFYNNLINDPSIMRELKKQNMTGEFYLHPIFEAQHQDFDENGFFKLMEFPYDYKKAIGEGELLISDYSSIIFDFVYLKKPIVYAKFDIDTYFEGHTSDPSSFFSDEEDGFGAVYYNYDSLVAGVVEMLRSGCKMSPKYKKRVESFFYRGDKNNCQRAYKAILELEQ